MVTLVVCFLARGTSQGFIAAVENEGIGALYGNQCILQLRSGEEVKGKFVGGTYVKNGLTKISIKLENGEKVKYEPEDLVSLHIRASDLLKLFLVSESASSVKELEKTDFDEIIQREYLIFETALTPKKSDTYRLLQLINPGFDTKIKVFAEPSAKTGGLSMGGIPITGGEDRAFLFVKGGEKAFVVKKGSYDNNFEELFADCPRLISAYEGGKIKWDNVALHVFFYDQYCD